MFQYKKMTMQYGQQTTKDLAQVNSLALSSSNLYVRICSYCCATWWLPVLCVTTYHILLELAIWGEAKRGRKLKAVLVHQKTSDWYQTQGTGKVAQSPRVGPPLSISLVSLLGPVTGRETVNSKRSVCLLAMFCLLTRLIFYPSPTSSLLLDYIKELLCPLVCPLVQPVGGAQGD